MMKRRQYLPSGRQSGAVLIVTLIVLVLMTLGAISMVRSVDTSTLISGNLAFQQSALQSSDGGVEEAVRWLEANPGALINDSAANGGYSASWDANLGPGGSWIAYWAGTITGTGRVRTLPEDGAGNTVSFLIQRLCPSSGGGGGGKAKSVGCGTYPLPPDACSQAGGSKTSTATEFSCSLTQYRITARVAGPRNTVTYVQSIVAL